MRYIDVYKDCNGCPVIKYCGTMVSCFRLCNSYQEPEKEDNLKGTKLEGINPLELDNEQFNDYLQELVEITRK